MSDPQKYYSPPILNWLFCFKIDLYIIKIISYEQVKSVMRMGERENK